MKEIVIYYLLFFDSSHNKFIFDEVRNVIRSINNINTSLFIFFKRIGIL